MLHVNKLTFYFIEIWWLHEESEWCFSTEDVCHTTFTRPDHCLPAEHTRWIKFLSYHRCLLHRLQRTFVSFSSQCLLFESNNSEKEALFLSCNTGLVWIKFWFAKAFIIDWYTRAKCKRVVSTVLL